MSEMKLTIELTSAQVRRLKQWQNEQNAKVAAKQKKSYAYYGAIGGGFSFIYTPTSVGNVIKVMNSVTKEEIDLTDYGSW
jgi:hypothetical protein